MKPHMLDLSMVQHVKTTFYLFVVQSKKQVHFNSLQWSCLSFRSTVQNNVKLGHPFGIWNLVTTEKHWSQQTAWFAQELAYCLQVVNILTLCLWQIEWKYLHPRIWWNWQGSLWATSGLRRVSEWVNCHQEESKGGCIWFIARRGKNGAISCPLASIQPPSSISW